ncbi:hypothetical protein BASA81_007850 [Batrachochytrium salamandrivorans]|nr:hypothetical protein BASA81_007850 [Batrachochytrium salamandrivorans]
MQCFVTVGTTSFDRLIEELNKPEVRQVLTDSMGVTELCLQIGRGVVQPQLDGGKLKVTWYDFKPTLMEDMQSADVIISHAGAGSIVESLRLNKRLIVVVNDLLMDNHQLELASALEQKGHLVCAPTPAQLRRALATTRLSVPYPQPHPSAFADLVNGEMF